MKGNLGCIGNHRGGISIVKALPAEVANRYDPDWVFADPKEDRARKLALVAQNRFPELRPRPLLLRGQEAVAQTDDDDALVVAVDTLADTRETLAARKPAQRATFQVVGRGPWGNAGVRTAFQGTLTPGDHETERRADLLFDTLDGMTREASSRVLTGTDPLTAAVLKPMRDIATRQTIRHLAEKEREPWDLSRGPLSMVLGTNVYPLVPVEGQPDDRHTHRKELALDVAGAVPEAQLLDRGPLGRFVIVAVVIPEDLAIHFMTVAQSRMGRRRLDGLTVFEPPVPSLAPAPMAVPMLSSYESPGLSPASVQATTPSPHVAPAMFTD